MKKAFFLSYFDWIFETDVNEKFPPLHHVGSTGPDSSIHRSSKPPQAMEKKQKSTKKKICRREERNKDWDSFSVTLSSLEFLVRKSNCPIAVAVLQNWSSISKIKMLKTEYLLSFFNSSFFLFKYACICNDNWSDTVDQQVSFSATGSQILISKQN